MQLTNGTYNNLKFVALILLPALAAAYFSLAQLLDLPNVEKVVGVMTILDTLLGVVLRASTSQFHKAGGNTDGDLLVVNDEDGRYLKMAVQREKFQEIPNKDVVTLRVVDQTRPLEK